MAKSKKVFDPYAELIEQLNAEAVEYVVVGMSGINYYAGSALNTFGTQDFDLFLRPDIQNAVKTFRVFAHLGYEMSTKNGFVNEQDLGGCLRQRRTILAVNADGIVFELLFAVSGFTYRQMSGDASFFKAGGALIRVGKLRKLLASKKAAGRPKDKLFLKRYEMILKKMKE